MIAFIVLLSVVAVLQLSPGNADFASESSNKRENQKEIVDKHNALRKSVRPTARNMLQMEWNSNAAQNAKRWADRCSFKHSPRHLRTEANPCEYVNKYSNCEALAKQFGCQSAWIKSDCPASCFCRNEII